MIGDPIRAATQAPAYPWIRSIPCRMGASAMCGSRHANAVHQQPLLRRYKKNQEVISARTKDGKDVSCGSRGAKRCPFELFAVLNFWQH